MKKLSFEALSAMSEKVANNALLEQISGGTENDCHDDPVRVPIQTLPINNR